MWQKDGVFLLLCSVENPSLGVLRKEFHIFFFQYCSRRKLSENSKGNDPERKDMGAAFLSPG